MATAPECEQSTDEVEESGDVVAAITGDNITREDNGPCECCGCCPLSEEEPPVGTVTADCQTLGSGTLTFELDEETGDWFAHTTSLCLPRPMIAIWFRLCCDPITRKWTPYYAYAPIGDTPPSGGCGCPGDAQGDYLCPLTAAEGYFDFISTCVDGVLTISAVFPEPANDACCPEGGVISLEVTGVTVTSGKWWCVETPTYPFRTCVQDVTEAVGGPYDSESECLDDENCLPCNFYCCRLVAVDGEGNETAAPTFECQALTGVTVGESSTTNGVKRTIMDGPFTEGNCECPPCGTPPEPVESPPECDEPEAPVVPEALSVMAVGPTVPALVVAAAVAAVVNEKPAKKCGGCGGGDKPLKVERPKKQP